MEGSRSLREAIEAGDASAVGDVAAIDDVVGNLDVFMTNFGIVEP